MKGVFWVVMMLGLLVTTLLIARNLSVPEALNGDSAGLQTIDHAKEAAELLNREAAQVDKMLRQPANQ